MVVGGWWTGSRMRSIVSHERWWTVLCIEEERESGQPKSADVKGRRWSERLGHQRRASSTSPCGGAVSAVAHNDIGRGGLIGPTAGDAIGCVLSRFDVLFAMLPCQFALHRLSL